MEELYIVDEEFDKYKEIIDKINIRIEKRLSQIIAYLNLACSGISEGNLHENLTTYVNKLSVMSGQMSYLTTEMKYDTDDFCSDIETIDTLND